VGVGAALALALAINAGTTIGAAGTTSPVGTTGSAGASSAAANGSPSGAASQGARRVVLAFIPPPRYETADPQNPTLLALMGRDSRLPALGLLGPTQGNYSEQQALLDMTQGTRVSRSTYRPNDPPALLVARSGTGARVLSWRQIAARGASAPQTIVPGLLAASIPGGAAYVSIAGEPQDDAVVAADRGGRIARVLAGTAATLLGRIRRALVDERFVVVDLPRAPGGLAVLDRLLAARAPDEVVLLVKQPPYTTPHQQTSAQMLSAAAAGLPGGSGKLTSDATRRIGIVAGIDVSATVLHELGLPIPSAMKGSPWTVKGRRSVAELQSLDARLRVISGRRLLAIQVFLLVWLAVALALGLLRDAAGRLQALRLGGLAVLWAASTVLIAGPLRPGRLVEMTIVIGGAFVLALATDRVAPWPRGPVLPAAVMLVAYTIDLVRGSPLIVDSLLGPNPLFGSRYYGLGNEACAGLSIVLLAGLAAALPARPATRRDFAAFVAGGLLLTLLASLGSLGGNVGAAFTIGGATAAGAVVMLPGGPRLGAAILAIGVPIALVGAIALVDLGTGAGGHFTRSVLHADSLDEVLTTLGRRLELAWFVLRHGLYPLDTVICALAFAYALRHRRRALTSLTNASAWQACFWGGAVGSVAGSVANDSGPLLLVVGTFALMWVAAYVRGRPAAAPTSSAGPARSPAAVATPAPTPSS
jgi:hypothetical protein